jgi:hypothetical protein
MLSQPLFEKGLECKAVFEESLNAEPSTPNAIKILVPKILWLNKKIWIITHEISHSDSSCKFGLRKRPWPLQKQAAFC